MFTVTVIRNARPVGVLLGGSGRPRKLPLCKSLMAALLRPLPLVEARAGSGVGTWAAVV